MPAVETVALRKSVTVTRHVAVRHPDTSRFGIEASPELITSQPDIEEDHLPPDAYKESR
jgi:hypothetical protein